jgi:hypothetical protein
MTSVSEVSTLMREAVSTYEMSINFYETTQHNNPEYCHIHEVTELRKFHNKDLHNL